MNMTLHRKYRDIQRICPIARITDNENIRACNANKITNINTCNACNIFSVNIK